MKKIDVDLENCIVKDGYNLEYVSMLTAEGNLIKRATKGYCTVCDKETVFIAKEYWLRDYYQCVRCHSIPRQRALMKVLSERKPEWRYMRIHESSPAGCLLEKFKLECLNYTYSYFDEKSALGSLSSFGGDNCTNQNLECMTFEDESFDIFITQDVFEHVANPAKAYKEIARVLKPGGGHIFTVPLYPFIATRSRIKVENGNVIPILPPVYHGNPISKGGSLVTYDWGHDIVEKIKYASGMCTEIKEFMHTEENTINGLEADFLWVLISTK